MADNPFINEKIQNDELVRLLGVVRDDNNEQNMIELLRVAATSKFIVPVDGSEGSYSFHAVSDKSGKRYMVAYSDSDSFEVAFGDKKQNGVVAGFGDLVDSCVEPSLGLSGFVINPGVEEVLFGHDMLRMIWTQMHGGDDTAKVGEPDHYPPKLKEMLEEYIKTDDSCGAIWVRLLRENSTDRLRWMIIANSSLEGDGLTYELENLKNYIKPYLDGMDAIVVSEKEDFAAKVIAGVKPFAGKGKH
ncbi:MAG: enhanced serine sensitivity protein SseB [Saccharofermentans sp.]|nr:enhanced serine sensitivity protein SseB [Mageeibacillus sp.]MCI1264531.1 enhanced serine sensitivity protein SseB [Saccharofermentans sp.]MCI1274680.1 enhanced serine sensitivity protein SseB [Saccharofermentans sp.]MCI1769314.1 enhanced serine sensitivity protein SseB [Mageeibacillus sp.]MCI2044562.1 enhanced serine sensitivity protein SseB [Mageeibacillus sp.]